MAVMSLFVGGAVAALFGAAGAGLLGIAYAVVEPRSAPDPSGFQQQLSTQPARVLIGSGAFFGGFLGGVLGCGLGAFLGLVAGFCQARARRKFLVTAMLSSAVVGAAVGVLGGAIVDDMGGAGHNPVLWGAIGAFIGASSGLSGGWVLGKILSSHCWGPGPPKAPLPRTAP